MKEKRPAGREILVRTCMLEPTTWAYLLVHDDTPGADHGPQRAASTHVPDEHVSLGPQPFDVLVR